MNKTARCRPGDLALVIGEEPGYEENLGRLVKVSGPPAMTPMATSNSPTFGRSNSSRQGGLIMQFVEPVV